MTRDDIIRMAREALIFPAKENDDNGTGMWATFTVYKGSIESLEKFATLVRADERESCARVCDARYMGDNNREDMEARRCAAAIRARRQQQ